jgi:hypothetical protein
MARGIYFSGDLAAINDAMASEERNRIAGRTANQGFLSNLAGQATARRGQDVTERVSNRQMDTDKSIASERTGVMSKQVDNDFQAALAANAMRGKAIEVEANKITAAERAGQLVDAREKDRINRLFQDNEAQRKAMVAIALIQSNAAQAQLNPRVAQATFEADMGVQAGNQAAATAAETANRMARDNARSWYLPESMEYVSPSDASAAFDKLTPEQQAMVRLPADGNMFTPSIQPRVKMPQQAATQGVNFLSILPQLLGLSHSAPSVAPPPIAPRSGPGDSMNPRIVTPMRPAARQRNVIPYQDIFRGMRTNAVETPANRMEQPVFEPGVANPNEVDLQALLQLLQAR